MVQVTLGKRPFKIRQVISKHYAWYDSFDQNMDSWCCNCDRVPRYRSRDAVNGHIVEEIMKVLHELEREREPQSDS